MTVGYYRNSYSVEDETLMWSAPHYSDAMKTKTVTVSEPSREEYEAWAETYTDRLTLLLRDQTDASELFATFVEETADSEREIRNSILMSMFRHNSDEQPSADDLRLASERGGSFFAYLWNGDVFKACIKADTNNRKFLTDAFDKSDVIKNALEHEGFNDRDYVTRMVEQGSWDW